MSNKNLTNVKNNNPTNKESIIKKQSEALEVADRTKGTYKRNLKNKSVTIK